MYTIFEQKGDLEANFNEVFEFQNNNFEIPLFPQVSVKIDLRNYPKKPKIVLPKLFKKYLVDIDIFLPSLKNWNKIDPPLLSGILIALKKTMETLSGKLVHISNVLFKELCDLGGSNHPNESLCILRIIDGELQEYILAPQMESSNNAAIFFPHRIGRDRTMVAVFHTHPSGNFHPSQEDLIQFRNKPINLILGAPYNVIHLGVYDSTGEKLDFEIDGL